MEILAQVVVNARRMEVAINEKKYMNILENIKGKKI